MTAHDVHNTSVDTPPLRAVNEITTIQKNASTIGTETISRNASSPDCSATRLRRAPRASDAQSAPAPAPAGTAAAAISLAISAPRFAPAAAACACPSVSYTHLRAHETGRNLVCRL